MYCFFSILQLVREPSHWRPMLSFKRETSTSSRLRLLQPFKFECITIICTIILGLLISCPQIPIEALTLEGSSKPEKGRPGSGKWDWQWNNDGYDIISDIANSVGASNCRFKTGIRMPIEFLSQVPTFNTILQVWSEYSSLFCYAIFNINENTIRKDI